MRAFQCEDLKTFTRELFTRERFDSFLVREASFVTFCRFSVDGKSERDWYTEEELEEERVEDYTSWGKLRPVCFQLIRGSRTPLKFQLSFRLPPAESERLAESCGIGTRLACSVISTRESVCPRFRPEEFGLPELGD